MHTGVRLSVEAERGCGYRKTGGIYLVAPAPGRSCGRLPLELTVCAACSHGIKPSRGVTWIVPRDMFPKQNLCPNEDCGSCPLSTLPAERAVLLWVGEKFYPSPIAYLREANVLGISRRVHALPKGFKLGATLVFLAHRFAMNSHLLYDDPKEGETAPHPGVFMVFRPSAVEVIVDGTEPDEKIESYLKRGLSPVQVIRSVDAQVEMKAV